MAHDRSYPGIAARSAVLAHRALILALLGAAAIPGPTSGAQPIPASPEPSPLIQAFSHNDERRARPLLDALDCGFCNIEVDVHLVEGRLLVGHNKSELKTERTLQKLYLDPLRERVRANAGRVYRGGSTLRLYLDFKTDAEDTYAALGGVLRDYRPMLTVFNREKPEPSAVTIVITGNRPLRKMAGEVVRYAACDGLLEDLDNRELDPLVVAIGTEWRLSFRWRGQGAMPDAERRKLAEIVAKAHKRGKLLRFWGAPDFPAAWAELHAASVDLINTDKPRGLREFLTKATPAPATQPE